MFKLVQTLQKIGVIQHGNFTLKSGATSSYYFDLRKIYSYPEVLVKIIDQLNELTDNQQFDLVCGVPLAGIPLATTYSVRYNVPMIVLRNERKDHGTQNLIEGNYKKGDCVLLLEDVVTTGGSINETCNQLIAEGLEVKMVAVIIDRSDTGISGLKSLLTLNDIMKLPQKMVSRKLNNSFSNELWEIMMTKRTNLCYSMDSYNIDFLSEIGDYICLLKLHLDIIGTVDYERLFKLAADKNFLILDDRKYADIGHIVQQQFNKVGIRSCTVHSIFGQSTLDGLKPHDAGCFLIAESSAKNNFISPEYTIHTYQLGQTNPELVAGFITQSRLGDDSFLYLTPGVNLTTTGDTMGQGYRSIETAVCNDGCDIIIVGRGIKTISDAKEYRDQGWKHLVNSNTVTTPARA
jgi:uridine monophosphate synthetase